ncbi:conserved hypothetical protein [Paecilomyces variotii No. 5]|uniref:25S rRNA (uridine-N(3))-methyltransferase BMT5-like domain-containing protein n=1 Tax=Byssochlamys spectabilis (strain No. 5 / NBRC 109023) TaxID=1356009 RepID=V5FUS7_BYSSN|nr:conserved hypothetical protein [Paecilomyces variotii No. 5]
MGKSKKPRIPNYNHADGPARRGNVGGGAGNRKMHTFSKLSSSSGSMAGKKGGGAGGKDKDSSKSLKQQKGKQDVKITVPFGRKDRILLVGEGDFSFARSLALHYRCRDILATCYDSKETLFSKYPHVEQTTEDFLSTFSGQKVDDSTGEKNEDQDQEKEKDNDDDEDDDNEETDVPAKDDTKRTQQQDRRGPKVLYSVDARKLGSAVGGGKLVRGGFPRRCPQRAAWENAKRGVDANSQPPTGGPWDVICFNFPHVGGLSTDVNRQVRANQELLVAFFKSCLSLLSTPMDVDEEVDSDEEFGSEYSDDDDDESDRDRTPNVPGKLDRWETKRTTPGQIVVTLFEGEPYTLWNIRDLARHAGLRVVTSFKFPWAAYPGYSHARTLGHIEGRDGGRGGWRGEEREARTYVFEIKGSEDNRSAKSSTQKGKPAGIKRTRDDSDSESS